MEMRRFRKFLILSTYAPPAVSGAPLMMYNLLRYFPSDSYSILTTHFGITNQSIKTGKLLPVQYFYFDTPTAISGLRGEGVLFQKIKQFIAHNALLHSFAHLIRLFCFPYFIVARGRKIIKQTGVELLLGYSDGGPALLGTYLLHRFVKKPFFLFFYDLYAGNAFPPLFRIVARVLEPRLFQDAEKIFVMSEALQAHYGEKYKREVIVIHNAVSSFPVTAQPISGKRGPRTIVFTGSVDWPQRQALRNLIRAVEAIENPEAQLRLYTPHARSFVNQQGILESKKVIFCSGLPDEMSRIQQEADILFVPLSFHTRYPLLINTSSPGKTYEYMVSGRPILVHAPRGSYIAEYAKEKQFALVVDEDDPVKLREAIMRLLTDKELVERLVRNAWHTAVEHHDAKKESQKFQQYFFR